MEMRNVTITDIAEQLDLSRSTIDRVLNERGGVAPDTKEKVLNYVKKLNYRPNRAAKHLSKRTNCNIGVSYYLPKAFAAQIKSGIYGAYEELKDFGLNIILREANSPEEQIKQIKEMKSEIDALAIAAWEPHLFEKIINDISDKGIPVVTFNIDAPDSKRLFYIGCNYTEAGRVCGEIIKKITPESGEIAVISNGNNSTGKQRIKGFKDVLTESIDPEKICIYNIHDDFDIEGYPDEKIISETKKIVNNNPGLMAIFVVNQTLYSVGQAIKEMDKQKEIKIIGFDLFEKFIPLIQEDVIQAVVCQEPYSQGYYPIKILFEIVAENRKVKKSNFITRLEIVMKENLKYYNDYRYLSG